MAAQVNLYIVDACGLIAYLRNEPGADKMKALLGDRLNRFKMHAVNLGEVYYDALRTKGKTAAEGLLLDVKRLPIETVTIIDEDLMKRAGRFKAENRISYADSYVLALAEREDSPVITTDHHEFDPIEAKGEVRFYWLR